MKNKKRVFDADTTVTWIFNFPKFDMEKFNDQPVWLPEGQRFP